MSFEGHIFFWLDKRLISEKNIDENTYSGISISNNDTIFSLPFHIPIYGDQVAFLPILLGISMTKFFDTKNVYVWYAS